MADAIQHLVKSLREARNYIRMFQNTRREWIKLSGHEVGCKQVDSLSARADGGSSGQMCTLRKLAFIYHLSSP